MVCVSYCSDSGIGAMAGFGRSNAVRAGLKKLMRVGRPNERRVLGHEGRGTASGGCIQEGDV